MSQSSSLGSLIEILTGFNNGSGVVDRSFRNFYDNGQNGMLNMLCHPM